MPTLSAAFRTRDAACLPILLLCALFFLAIPANHAQTRVSDRDMIALMRNLRDDSKAFQPRFNSAVQKSTIRKTSQEKDAKKLVETFVRQTDGLVQRFKKDRNGADAFTTVMNTAQQVDATVNSVSLGQRVNEQWQKVRTEVQQLAAAYNIPSSLGSGSAANGSPATYAPMAAAIPDTASGKGTTWLRISAFATAPLAGADVAVYDMKGKRIFQKKDALNEYGVYPARLDHLPADFRVTVTLDGASLRDAGLRSMGKFTLMADERNFDATSGVVYVNPVTTLVSRVAEKLPGHNLAAAQARVRRFLVLPRNADLGAAMLQNEYYRSPYFAETAFLDQAQRHGGMDRFVNDLTPQMLRNSISPHPFVGAPTAAAAGPLAFIGKNLASGALQWIGGQGVGWVLESAGIITPGATKADIDRLEKEMVALRASVANLSAQIEDLQRQMSAALTDLKYFQKADKMNDWATSLGVLQGDLNYFARACPTRVESSPPPDPKKQAYCTEEKKKLENGLYEKRGMFALFSANLLDSREPGMIHLFSQARGQTIRFFRPADSTIIQEMYEYWAEVQTEAADQKVEYLHATDKHTFDPAQLTDFLGNVNANPATDGEFQKALAAEKKLLFPPLPVFAVINTRDRTMWLLSPIPDWRNCVGNLDPGLPKLNPADRSAQIHGLDWRSPPTAQMESLISGWTGANVNQWLTDKTRAQAPEAPVSPGFPDYLGAKDLIKCEKLQQSLAWTRDVAKAQAGWGVSYFALNLHNGKFVSGPETRAGFQTLWRPMVRDLSAKEQYYWYPGQ